MAAKPRAAKAKGKDDSATRSLPYEERTQRRTGDHLSATEKAFRQKFVARYFRLGNAKEAYWGLNPEVKSSTAATQASEMLREPYVLELIDAHLAAFKDKEFIEREHVKMALWREGNHFGGDAQHGSRVSALTTLTKILGMQIEKERNPKNPVMPSGVMYVPLTAKPEDWTRLAVAQQAALSKEANE